MTENRRQGTLAQDSRATGQDAVFAFLADPATHSLSEPIKRIDTHAAAVFLAGKNVYKVKKAIRFPFMDQSTLARRHGACEAEVTVNRRFTPDLYLGIVPIVSRSDGLHLGGPGETVEWAVHLNRFDENRTLDLVAERGELTSPLIARIAELILASHRAGAVSDGARATAALAEVVTETLDELTGAPDIFPPERAATLASTLHSAFASVRGLLLERGGKARVRRCHGDLHLRNIALLDRGPILFDAIEFDESIATTDVLYDLAFVLMDLWERRLHGEANLLLNRYLWGCDDIAGELAGLAALPAFLGLRASVRAKIDAIRLRDVGWSLKDETLGYFDSAIVFLQPSAPLLVAIGGLSGAGKTTLAGRIASTIGRAPGAVHLRSDIERKRLLGVPEVERLPPSAYRPELTETVFASLREQTEIALKAGHSVIVDAVHRKEEERRLIADVAARADVGFIGLWLDAPVDALIARVRKRLGDASDATGEIVTQQAREDAGPLAWTRLDASVTPETLADVALAACMPTAPLRSHRAE